MELGALNLLEDGRYHPSLHRCRQLDQSRGKEEESELPRDAGPR